MTVLNTIIFYDNYLEVEQFCRDVFAIDKEQELYISIAINKMTDEADYQRLVDLTKVLNRISIYRPEQNLGYMNGMIYAYECFVDEKKIDPDYVIMSNTDIIYQDPEFFNTLRNTEYPADLGAIGPSVFAKKRNSYDNPVCLQRRSKAQVKKVIRFTSIPVIRSLYVFLSDFKARLFASKKEPESTFAYELHGCFFIVTKRLAKELVKHKFGMLLYSEESYIAEEALKHHLAVYYDANLKIIHNEHSVTGHIKYSKIAKYISSSMQYILDTYYD